MNEVGFLLPDGKKIEMAYHEVYHFCKQIYEQDHSNFGYRNNLFDSYFDYVMQEKGYIFINPLLQRENYLVAYQNQYYQIPKIEVAHLDLKEQYQALKEKVIYEQEKDMLLMEASDIGIGLQSQETFLEGFITPTGLFLDKRKCPGHWVLANTIVNQYLIKDPSLTQVYKNEMGGNMHRSELFLVHHLGFLEVDVENQQQTCVFLINQEKTTKIQKEYIENKLMPTFTFEESPSFNCGVQTYIGSAKEKRR